MARLHLLSVVLGLLVFTGCQSASVVDTLPSPNFAGPQVLQHPAPLPVVAITPVQKPTVAPAPKSGTLSGIPAAWVAPAGAPARPWRWIVIHHSATPTGGAVAFDKMHKEKGWDELGYHFVIGNGTDTADGQVEVGPRWPKQKWGAHARTPDNRYNEYGIGICLVGNFDLTHPSRAQMQSTAKLCAYLMKTYHITPENVIRHKDTKPTECPGTNTNIEEIRRMAVQMIADADGTSVSDAEASLASATQGPATEAPVAETPDK